MAATLVSPVIAFSNFLLLAYNFTGLKDTIPFHLFVPLFIVSILVLLVTIGKLFRMKQQATDITLSFERSVEANKSIRIITEYMIELGKKLDVKTPKEILDRVEYLKKIERQDF
jgi:hypothetical protein